MNEIPLRLSRINCPCCKFPTLTRSAEDDICELCNWQDDGQDELTANEVWGGPNSRYSLTEARQNFDKYRVIYEPENDPRFTGGDSPLEYETKGQLMGAFQAFESATNLKKVEIARLIFDLESILVSETERQIRDYVDKNFN